jgi:hypothetical protein
MEIRATAPIKIGSLAAFSLVHACLEERIMATRDPAHSPLPPHQINRSAFAYMERAAN